MTNAYKPLGATVVVANVDTQHILVGAGKQIIIAELTICNTGSTARTFRVAHCPGAIGGVAIENYKAYDCAIEGSTSIVICAGLSMAATNTILVRANHADVVFNSSGVEIT